VLLSLCVGLESSTFAADTSAIANDKCLECHSLTDLWKTNAAGRAIHLFVDVKLLTNSVHATNTCFSCHNDLKADHPDDNVAAKPVNCAPCHERQSESFGASVHGIAVKAGTPGAATCVDCHGNHTIHRPTSPDSRLHFTKLAATCGECHSEAADDVALSVHGRGAAAGERESATCTDCHAEHSIHGLKGSSAMQISQEVCSKCHASERINTKFRLPKDRVKTFFESFHGLAAKGGSTLAANCASCHGYHKILPSADAASTIHPTHLVETCGKCHPGATENFVAGKIHMDDLSDDGVGMVVNRWVRRIYLALIFGTISALLLHNGAAWFKKAMAARRAAGPTVQRMNRSQRVQHFILLSSFIILAVTGFALKFPDSGLSRLMGAEEVRRWIHRVSGVLMIVAGFYHVIYILFTKDGRRLVRDFWPAWQDARDVLTSVRYLSGRSAAHPRYGRFGYAEKFEYWAVVWGTIIMGATGLIIWLKIDVTRFLPRWVVDVSTTIHYYEAILACLAIIVWHFYHVIFDPDVYPMNWAWWNGKVSKHWHDEEHPLAAVEGEEIKPGGAAPQRSGSGAA
jgi:formate dehydrogenase gamma subunit